MHTESILFNEYGGGRLWLASGKWPEGAFGVTKISESSSSSRFISVHLRQNSLGFIYTINMLRWFTMQTTYYHITVIKLCLKIAVILNTVAEQHLTDSLLHLCFRVSCEGLSPNLGKIISGFSKTKTLSIMSGNKYLGKPPVLKLSSSDGIQLMSQFFHRIQVDIRQMFTDQWLKLQ